LQQHKEWRGDRQTDRQCNALLALTAHPHCLQTQTGRWYTSLCCPPSRQCSSSPVTHSNSEQAAGCTVATTPINAPAAHFNPTSTLVLQSHNTMICHTAEELRKLLFQICWNQSQSQPVHTVAMIGAAITGGNHEHQDHCASVRMNSDSPPSLWSWQAETMHFKTSVQLNTNSLHNSTTILSVIPEHAQRIHNYCMYPIMR
jgi:hypothetical protein